MISNFYNLVSKISGTKLSKRSYNKLSKEYNIDSNIIDRLLDATKTYDFYPTPDICLNNDWINDVITESHNILEPSYGVGNIINYIHKLNPNANITGYELSPDLYNISKQILLPNDKIKLYNEDFLEHDFMHNDFDTIICNPPFTRTWYEGTKKKVDNKFYYDFLFKCIRILKQSKSLNKRDQYIIFICPPLGLEDYNSLEGLLYDKNLSKQKLKDLFKNILGTRYHDDYETDFLTYERLLSGYIQEIGECNTFSGTKFKTKIYKLSGFGDYSQIIKYKEKLDADTNKKLYEDYHRDRRMNDMMRKRAEYYLDRHKEKQKHISSDDRLMNDLKEKRQQYSSYYEKFLELKKDIVGLYHRKLNYQLDDTNLMKKKNELENKLKKLNTESYNEHKIRDEYFFLKGGSPSYLLEDLQNRIQRRRLCKTSIGKKYNVKKLKELLDIKTTKKKKDELLEEAIKDRYILPSTVDTYDCNQASFKADELSKKIPCRMGIDRETCKYDKLSKKEKKKIEDDKFIEDALKKIKEDELINEKLMKQYNDIDSYFEEVKKKKKKKMTEGERIANMSDNDFMQMIGVMYRSQERRSLGQIIRDRRGRRGLFHNVNLD
jgi:tRNA1(Val) A37 N6-methylase TrmN6